MQFLPTCGGALYCNHGYDTRLEDHCHVKLALWFETNVIKVIHRIIRITLWSSPGCHMRMRTLEHGNGHRCPKPSQAPLLTWINFNDVNRKLYWARGGTESLNKEANPYMKIWTHLIFVLFWLSFIVILLPHLTIKTVNDILITKPNISTIAKITPSLTPYEWIFLHSTFQHIRLILIENVKC